MRRFISSATGNSFLWGLLLCGIAALLVRTPVARATVAPQPDFAAVDAFIQEQMARHRIPGLALGIVHGGEIAYLRGYGNADDAPVTPQSRFYIGSISKSFTALAVMQLAEAGRIDLDTPVQHYLSWFTVADEESAARISVRHLLNQTSGLSERGYRRDWESQPLEAAVRDLHQALPVAEPGEAFHYFNSNYEVLGLLVKEVSGLSYADYVQEHILEPLAMENSSAESGAEVIQGYGLALGLPVPLSEPALEHGVPSGFIVSTAEDMARYLIAQLNGGAYDGERVLSTVGIETLHAPGDVGDSSYGMGWDSAERDGMQVIQHAGDLLTFHADAILLPEQDYGVVLLINQNNLLSSFFAWPTLSTGIIDLLVGQTPESSLPVGILSLVVGVIVAVSVVRDLRSLWRLRRWEKRVVEKSKGALARELLRHGVAIALPLLLPLLLSFLLERTVTLRVMFAFLPDLTLLLVFEAILAALLLVVKGWLLARHHGRMRRTMSAEMKFTHLFLILVLASVVALSRGQQPPLWAQTSVQTISRTITDREYVRNPDFDLGWTGWRVNIGPVSVKENAGQTGAGLEIDHSFYSSLQQSFTLHEIHLPDDVTAGTFAVDYRFELGQQPGLDTFRALILALGDEGLEPLVEALAITADTFPGADIWHSQRYPLTPADLQKIVQAHAARKRVFVYVDLVASGMKANVDNVSLVLSGMLEVPQLIGSIAYVGFNEQGKPQTLKRIEPNGSDEQILWTHPGSPFGSDPELRDPAWRPDGTEIAFVSNHEEDVSAFRRDIYALAPDGTRERRITNTPARSQMDQFPTGSVSGRIYNNSDYEHWEINPMLVYVQGAGEPVAIDPPVRGESVAFTVPNVADLGPGMIQTVTVVWSLNQDQTLVCTNARELLPAAAVDVQAGQTVDVGEPSFLGKCDQLRAAEPSWQPDGSTLAFVGPGGALQQIPASGGAIGAQLVDVTAADVAWSPNGQQLLYVRIDANASGAYLTEPGDGPGTQLVNEAGVQEVAWLPDGAGFLYSQRGESETRNLGQYKIQSNQMVMLTDFLNEVAANPSVSPDGRYAVFERQAVLDPQSTFNTVGPRDLWMIDLQNPVRMWPLTSDGRSGDPAWSRVEPQTPQPTATPSSDATATPTPTPTPTQVPDATATPTPTLPPDFEPTDFLYLPNLQRR